jgi:hypothetical protein
LGGADPDGGRGGANHEVMPAFSSKAKVKRKTKIEMFVFSLLNTSFFFLKKNKILLSSRLPIDIPHCGINFFA